MSINLFLKATAKEPVFFDDDMNPTDTMECFLYQTPASVSYAAVAEGADPYQVYADWMMSRCEDRKWAQEHLYCVQYFLELAKEKGAIIEWYCM